MRFYDISLMFCAYLLYSRCYRVGLGYRRELEKMVS